jgi:hypothetical protein
MTLPFSVKKTRYRPSENGVLEQRLAKAEESKAKKIEIKARLSHGKQENGFMAKVPGHLSI